jgi:two-component system nitrate/nitrite response regulator NarL
MSPVRILVVDDQALFRRGLVALLAAHPSLEVVGEAADGVDAVRWARALQPDLVLMENHLPRATGIQAIAELRKVAPLARIVLLTVSDDDGDLHAALRAGANGYLLKTVDGDALVEALHRVMDGQPVISPELMARLVATLRAAGAESLTPMRVEPHPEGAAQLSPREQEVLQQITRGASNKEIARTLRIAETTVKIHVQHILRKLGVSSRVQAAVMASSSHSRF